MNVNKKILILGASGMLGSMLFQHLSDENNLCVYGTYRNPEVKKFFKPELGEFLINVDVDSEVQLRHVIDTVSPHIIINCIGLVKKLNLNSMILEAININARLPHTLNKICKYHQSRLIQFSTDCIFSGAKGMYTENDLMDAKDIYGVTKFLGEIPNSKNTLTIRTSIIGPEFNAGHSLLNWFLRQGDSVFGYRKAIFSGLPTIEIAKILKELIIPNEELHGLYHLSGDPISKYDLLTCIAKIYNKRIIIKPDDLIVIDRSLDSGKFKSVTGYQSKSWDVLVDEMHKTTIA